MAQFDVHHNETGFDRDTIPFLLDVQSSPLVRLNTRVVVPLRPKASVLRPISHLNPTFNISGTELVLMVEDIFTAATTDLGECIGSLSEQRDQVIRAIDFLITGY